MFVQIVVAKKWLKINFREKIHLKDPYYFCQFWGVDLYNFFSRSKNDRVMDQKIFFAISFYSPDQNFSKSGIHIIVFSITRKSYFIVQIFS